MNFYEIQYQDPLTKYSKYSSNAYTFMYTNINNINLYYQLRQKQKQKQKQKQQQQQQPNIFYHHSDHSMEENDENEQKNTSQRSPME